MYKRQPYHYRNKVQAAFGVNRQGQIISGVYQSASHRIVPVSDCMIEDTVADQIIVTIRGLLKSFKIRPYDEDTGRGTLRHVLVRRGWRSGEILVVLVTAHGMLPGKRNFVRALLQRHPDITTIVPVSYTHLHGLSAAAGRQRVAVRAAAAPRRVRSQRLRADQRRHQCGCQQKGPNPVRKMGSMHVFPPPLLFCR